MSKYELFEPQNETFEEFVSRNMGLCGENKFTSEALKGLVNEEFDNILYCQGSKGTPKGIKGYETEIKYSHNKYYEFTTKPVPKKIDIRFGCELETCFILNCRKDVREEINEILEGESIERVGGKKWQNLIYYYLRNNIIPYLKPEFTNIFRFAYIYPGYHSESGFFLDMKNGNIVSKNLKDEGYRTLIFEPDGSIKCDKTQSKDEVGNVYDSIPVPCEIVTPVLSSIEDLRILYEGLLPKHNDFPCNQSNPSMGFHVNVSAVDEKGKIVELTRGMFAELIYDWLPYEKKNYKSLRGEGSVYAKKIQDYINDDENIKLSGMLISNKNDEKLSISEIYEPYGVALWYTTNIINNEKFLSMTHHKQNNVVEFRVFNSSTDIEKLISYTQDAIEVFRVAIQKYCDKPEETLIQFQKRNLKYKYITLPIPFKYFEGKNMNSIYNYLYFRKDSKLDFGFAETSKFLGFGKKTVYGYPGLLIRKYDKFKVIVIFNDKSEKYYFYDIVKETDKVIIKNPLEISKDEYKFYKSEHKKNYRFRWEDYFSIVES